MTAMVVGSNPVDVTGLNNAKQIIVKIYFRQNINNTLSNSQFSFFFLQFLIFI